MHVYPGIFMLVGLVRSAVVLYGLLGKWSQSVRDKEFLVEMRLRNHEPEKEVLKFKESAVDPDLGEMTDDEGEDANEVINGEGAREELAARPI